MLTNSSCSHSHFLFIAVFLGLCATLECNDFVRVEPLDVAKKSSVILLRLRGGGSRLTGDDVANMHDQGFGEIGEQIVPDSARRMHEAPMHSSAKDQSRFFAISIYSTLNRLKVVINCVTTWDKLYLTEPLSSERTKTLLVMPFCLGSFLKERGPDVRIEE